MPALRLRLYQKTVPDMYSVTNPKQYQLYQEVLSFDGGMGFASEDEVIVQKKDGTVFRAPIRHYETDVLTETYLGTCSNGERFRFLFANPNNPLAQRLPLIGFAGLSTTEWAVHFEVF